jgi:tight adherence protein B
LLGLGALFTATRTDRSAAGGLRSVRAGSSDNNDIDDGPTGFAGRLESLADRAIGQGDRRRGLAMVLDVAALTVRPGEFVVLSFIGSLVLALLMSTFMGWWGVVLGAALAPLCAWAWVNHRADRRRHQFDEQLPDTLQLIVSLLRSGYGLPQALDAVANQVAEPTVAEFRRVLFEVRIGRDPTDALAATADRMRSSDFAWVVQAIHINREVGGELAAILESVGETVRERQRLNRQVKALTAEGRLSAVLLTGLPIGLVVVLSLMNPGYFDPLKETPGVYLVGVAVVLLCVGWVWMRHIIKVRT